MGFGGPVWHASARGETDAMSWALAERALKDVGDPSLGEWRERGNSGIVHVRRRLTADERASVGGLDVRDVRGTGEERRRLAAAARGVRTA